MQHLTTVGFVAFKTVWVDLFVLCEASPSSSPGRSPLTCPGLSAHTQTSVLLCCYGSRLLVLGQSSSAGRTHGLSVGSTRAKCRITKKKKKEKQSKVWRSLMGEVRRRFSWINWCSQSSRFNRDGCFSASERSFWDTSAALFCCWHHLQKQQGHTESTSTSLKFKQLLIELHYLSICLHMELLD